MRSIIGAVAMLLAFAGCDQPPPPTAGQSCVAGDLVCGQEPAPEAGADTPVLYCMPGSNPTYVQVMACNSCTHVSGDPTEICCDGSVDFAVLGGRCVLANAAACAVDNGTGAESILKCNGATWEEFNVCSASEHCENVDTTGTSIELGCR